MLLAGRLARTRQRRGWSRLAERATVGAMDGIYDLGGVTGFGPVEVERDEPVFHEPWEPLGYGLGSLGLSVLSAFNMDEIRHAIERIEPRRYLASSYYDRIVI